MTRSSRERGHKCNLRLIHVDVWQKPTQYCKAITLQLKIHTLKKKKRMAGNEMYCFLELFSRVVLVWACIRVLIHIRCISNHEHCLKSKKKLKKHYSLLRFLGNPEVECDDRPQHDHPRCQSCVPSHLLGRVDQRAAEDEMVR